jgi:ubiquinone/menaquinone biosynthesis C-methylase UbiE/uncharacterized protein YbaR (Trm112 family)
LRLFQQSQSNYQLDFKGKDIVDMKHDSLELLRCPVCKSELSFNGKTENGVILEGSLCCEGCGHVYPVADGIPRFIAAKELVGSNRKFERVYNWMSHLYDSDFFIASRVRRRFWPSGEDKARREVVGRLEITDNSKVLETGIGTGGNIPYISGNAHGVKVYGLDISVGMLNQCIKNLDKWELEADLFLGNAEELPFRDECFDVVFHLGGVNFFTEKSKAIEEMIRVAKPETRIVIADETEKVTGGRVISSLLGNLLFHGRQVAGEMSQFRSEDMVSLIPSDMSDVRFDYIWEGYGYRLEFRKPKTR